MHEVSLVHALFDQSDRALGAHPAAAVRLVRVRIGELAGVERELFETAFDGCRAERGYAAATLDVVPEAAAWRCRACGVTLAPGGPLRCAGCGDAGDVALVAGDALFLDRLELEVRDV